MVSLAQGVVGFQYEEDRVRCGMTSLAGLSTYLDLMEASGLGAGIERHLEQRAACQGWTDREMVESLVLLNVASGDCVEDLRMLEADAGLRHLLARAQGRSRRLQERERARR